MKKTDIQVGARLAFERSAPSSQWYRPAEVEVVEVGTSGSGQSYQGLSTYPTHFTGTRVRFVKGGRTEVVNNTFLREPWDVWVGRKTRQDKAWADAKRSAASRRADRLVTAYGIQTRLVEHGFDVYPERSYRLATDYAAVGFDVENGDGAGKSAAVYTVFANLTDHVEDGKPLLISALTVDEVLS